MFENTESGLMTDEGFRADDFNQVYESALVEAPQEQDSGKWALRGRLRSRVLWAAVLGCVMTVFSAFNLWPKLGITAEVFREIAASVGAVLALLGVFNDPTERGRF